MPQDAPSFTFERLNELEASSPTLVEGLPGLGMVASIAVDRVRSQLDLTHHGNILSEALPPVVTFREGRIDDNVRVFTGADPAIMTLESAVPIPEEGYKTLSRCVLQDLAPEFSKAVFLVGVPAESEEELHKVFGVATTDELRSELDEAGIERAEGTGVIGGATGAILSACFHEDVPAIALLVKAHPQLPDPGAAKAVIEEGLEKLVAFDVDTSELEEQAERIHDQTQEITQQLQQMMGNGSGTQGPDLPEANSVSPYR